MTQTIFEFVIGAIALYAALLNTINCFQIRRWQDEQRRRVISPIAPITHYRASRREELR